MESWQRQRPRRAGKAPRLKHNDNNDWENPQHQNRAALCAAPFRCRYQHPKREHVKIPTSYVSGSCFSWAPPEPTHHNHTSHPNVTPAQSNATNATNATRDPFTCARRSRRSSQAFGPHTTNYFRCSPPSTNTSVMLDGPTVHHRVY